MVRLLPVTVVSFLSTQFCTAFVLQRSGPSWNNHRRIDRDEASQHQTRPSRHLFSSSSSARLILNFEPSSASSSTDNLPPAAIDIDESRIESPVLQKVLPDLLEHVRQYGHANIPLGTAAGRQCGTLRRLKTEQKLNAYEVQLLEDVLNFTFESLEDVYFRADFDSMLQQLKDYAAANDGDLSPPKKYPANPTLGAWVTGLRRLYNHAQTTTPTDSRTLDPDHVAQLDALGFQWTSPRKCGSKFMIFYRSLLERLAAAGGDKDQVEAIWNEPEVQQWLQAQRQAYQRNGLSETRTLYLEELVGRSDWWKIEDDEE